MSGINTLSFIVEGPKWAGLGSAIKDLAFKYQLKLEMDQDTGWIRERYRVKMTGEESKVKEAHEVLLGAIKQYENG